MALRSIVVGQFKRPHGMLGRLAGFVMAHRPSNRKRSDWTVELLAVNSRHRILEIGCGPGVALQRCAGLAQDGYVLGVDHSELMVRLAQAALSKHIEAGRADVRRCTVFDDNLAASSWDRIYSVNVVQFFSDIESECSRIHDLLVPGGKAATTFQPRSQSPTRKEALEMATSIESAMDTAGFVDSRRQELPLEPSPAICVLGTKASAQ